MTVRLNNNGPRQNPERGENVQAEPPEHKCDMPHAWDDEQGGWHLL